MANNKLPYGLCKEYGIDLPEGATPKQAWEALDKKGINLEDSEWKTGKADTSFENNLPKEFTSEVFKTKEPIKLSSGDKIEKIVDKMSFSQYNHGKGNSKFLENDNYTMNCTLCILADSYRMSGYDVEALPYDKNDKIIDYLCTHPNAVYIDPKTGKPPRITRINSKDRNKALLELMEEGKTYGIIVSFNKVSELSNEDFGGHIVKGKREGNKMFFYDPQPVPEAKNRKILSGLVSDFEEFIPNYQPEYFFQITGMEPNPQIAPFVLRRASKPLEQDDFNTGTKEATK